MHILALSPAEVAHAVKRFLAYRNSPAAIRRHFANRGEHARERICRRIHAAEIELGIDLGALCGRFATRDEPGTSPIARTLLELLAGWATVPEAGGDVLLVRVDHVRLLNALAADEALERRQAALDLARALVRRPDLV